MLIILHFGNLWGLYVQLTTVPKFMAEVVGFDLKSSGGLSALPQLIRLFTGMFFGNMEDFLKSRKLLSTVAIRKGFVVCCKYTYNKLAIPANVVNLLKDFSPRCIGGNSFSLKITTMRCKQWWKMCCFSIRYFTGFN